jgi:hypothetical protein
MAGVPASLPSELGAVPDLLTKNKTNSIGCA